MSEKTEPQEDLWRKASPSYFPILVMFDDTGEEVAFDAPSDIPAGRSFRVLGIKKVSRRQRWTAYLSVYAMTPIARCAISISHAEAARLRPNKSRLLSTAQWIRCGTGPRRLANHGPQR